MNIIYKTAYYIMIVSYLILSIYSPTLKGKAIGLLLTIVNALIFYN